MSAAIKFKAAWEVAIPCVHGLLKEVCRVPDTRNTEYSKVFLCRDKNGLQKMFKVHLYHSKSGQSTKIVFENAPKAVEDQFRSLFAEKIASL